MMRGFKVWERFRLVLLVSAAFAAGVGSALGGSSEWKVTRDETGSRPLAVRGSLLAAPAKTLSALQATAAASAPTATSLNAVGVLDRVAEVFSISNAAAEFQILSTTKDRKNRSHVRLQQVNQGLKVLGGELIVHFNADGSAYEVNGSYITNAAVSIVPAITKEQAVAAAYQARTNAGEKLALTLKRAPELVIAAQEECASSPRLAWSFALGSALGSGVPEYWEFAIDAQTGTVIYGYDDVKHATAETLPPGEAVTISGQILTTEGGTAHQVTGWRASGTGLYYLENTNLHWRVGWYPDATGADDEDFASLDWRYITSSNAAWQSTANPPSNILIYATKSMIEFGAAYNVDQVMKYYSQVHQRASYDGAGSPAVVNLYYSDPDNAFWQGDNVNQFFIGYGATKAYDMGVLDVMGHELTHGVTDSSAKLAYKNDAGALNESFSDIFGACIEFFAQPDGRAFYPKSKPGYADWLLGEDAWHISPALRDMRNPHNEDVVEAASLQPSRYQGQYWYTGTGDNGGVHCNSGVQNFFFYLLSDGGSGTNETVVYHITGIGITNAEQIAYSALTAHCTASETYQTIRSVWLSAALDCAETPEQTNTFVQTVNVAWDAVMGILPATVPVPTLASGRIGVPYSAPIAISGGTDPYVVKLADGSTLPAGLTMTSGGVISGYPTAAGTNTFSIIITSRDGAGSVSDPIDLTLVILPAFQAPFEDTFEDAATLDAHLVNWNQDYLTNAYSWITCSGNSAGNPSVPAEGAANAYLGVYRNGTATLSNHVTRLVSPFVQFPADAYAAQVSFYLNMESWGNTYDELRVYYRTSPTEPWTYLTNSTSISVGNGVWEHKTFTLPGTAAGAVYSVAFEGSINGSAGICIDDVVIGDPTPALAITNVSPIVAYVQTNYPASSPVAVLSAVGGWDGTYTFTVVSNSLPAGFSLAADGTITGSSAGTESSTFAVEVRDSKGKVATNVLTLAIEYPRAALLDQSFDLTDTFESIGWSQELVSGNCNAEWKIVKKATEVIASGKPIASYSPLKFAYFFAAPGVGHSMVQRLLTPVINVAQMPGKRRLAFYHDMEQGNDGLDELRVYWRETTNDTWNLLADYTEATTRWTQRSIALPSASLSGIQFAFEGQSNNGCGIGIDSVSLTDESSSPIITSGSSLPSAYKGFSYSTVIQAIGGIEPYTWSGISLPAGLSLTPADDTHSVTLAGKTTVTNANPYTFSLVVTGADGLASTNSFTMKLLPAGAIPLAENFDKGLPDGWTLASIKNLVNWSFAQGTISENYRSRIPETTSTGTGTNAVLWHIFISEGGYSMADLVSPQIDLGNNSSNVVIVFQLCMAPYSPGSTTLEYSDILEVDYRTSLSADWMALTNIQGSAHAYTNWAECRVSVPNPSSTAQIRFRGLVNGGNGICIDDMSIQGDVVDTRTPYQKWVDANFPAGYPGDASDQPSGDGIPNLLKYAMGLDPAASNVSVVIWGGLTDLVSNVQAPDGNYLYLRYRRSLAATDIQFFVEARTNLTDKSEQWTTNDVLELGTSPWVVGEAGVWSWVDNIHLVPSTNAPMRFLRLRVVHEE